MLAYKFLSADAIAPFTGRPWPLPGPRAPGAWIVAPSGDLARYGVHACRMEDLPYWPDEQLWLVELGEPIEPMPLHVAAGRGRLLQRITAWNAAGAREYAAACAWRARDEASVLRACIDLVSLQASATAVAGDAARDEPRGLAAYAAGAAMRARQGRYPEASLQCAHLGAALTGSEAGAGCERAWQARWLAHRLELHEIAARSGVDALTV